MSIRHYHTLPETVVKLLKSDSITGGDRSRKRIRKSSWKINNKNKMKTQKENNVGFWWFEKMEGREVRRRSLVTTSKQGHDTEEGSQERSRNSEKKPDPKQIHRSFLLTVISSSFLRFYSSSSSSSSLFFLVGFYSVSFCSTLWVSVVEISFIT